MKILGIENEKVVVLLIFLGGLGLRLVQANVGFWHDEAASLIIAAGSAQDVLSHIKGDFHPPMFYLILNAWLGFGFKNEALIRLPFILISSLTVPATYYLGKRMSGLTRLGLWSAVLIAVNPLHIYYSGELRMYGVSSLLAVLSWYFLLGKKNNKNLSGYLISVLTGLFTFYGIWLVFASQVLVLIYWKKYKWLLASIVSALVLMTVWWPVFSIQLTGGSFMKESLPGWSTLSGDLSFKSVALIPLKIVTGRLNISGDRWLAISSMGALGYAGLICFLAVYKNRSRLALWALAAPVVLAIIISFKIPMLGYWRYIYLTPLFSILLGYGLLRMDRFGQQLNFGALFVILLFCNITYWMTPGYWREDWRGAGKFFEEFKGQNTVAIYTFFEPFPAAQWYIGGLPSSAVLKELKSSPAMFEEKMARTVEGRETILVFDYLNDLTDPGRSAKSWLERAGFEQKGVYGFRGVGQIYEYQPDMQK